MQAMMFHLQPTHHQKANKLTSFLGPPFSTLMFRKRGYLVSNRAHAFSDHLAIYADLDEANLFQDSSTGPSNAPSGMIYIQIW